MDKSQSPYKGFNRKPKKGNYFSGSYQSPYKGFNSFERGFLYANFHISDSCINPPIRGSIVEGEESKYY